MKKEEKTAPAKPETAKPAKPETEQDLIETELDEVAGGSQSTGAGAGKITFNPFSIKRK